MKISVFLGSVRNGRAGERVAKWISQELEKRNHEVHLIDPLEHEDLLVLEGRYKDKESPSEDFKKLKETIEKSDAYIAITPEYNHSFSGALKSALDCFFEEYFFKCFGIVTYSGGSFGGIRAAEPLRSVCAELGAPAIPVSLPVSKVSSVLEESGKLIDDSYQKRVDKFLSELEWYAEALKSQREKGRPY